MSDPVPNPPVDDGELLRRYCEERSQDAFTELVARHINFVYSSAMRRVGGDAHLADDVTQGVFTDLARKAPQLRGRTLLAGWLYTSTRFAAAHVVRTERRRRNREQEAQVMIETAEGPAPEWETIRPLIDEAMDELNERERDVVLLRYFSNLPLAEVGARLAVSPDAARMRVDRALEKLRHGLVRRGVSSTPAALGLALAAQSGLAAPAGQVAHIAAHALSQAAGAAAPFGLWKPATLVAAAVVATWLAWPRRDPAAPPPVPATPAASPTVAPSAPLPSTPVPSAPATPPPGAPAPSPAMRPLEARRPFAALTEMQKFIMKTLWERHKVAPNIANSRWAFRPGTGAPDYEAFVAAARALSERRLTGMGAQGGVFLTPAGAAFGEANRAEIDAYPTAADLTLFRARLTREPAFRAEVGADARARLDLLYGPLFAELNLPGEKLTPLKDFLVEKQFVGFETVGALRDAGIQPADVPETTSEATSKAHATFNQSIKELLGAADYERMQAYARDLTPWIAINSLADRLRDGPDPLTREQARQLHVILRDPASATGPILAVGISFGSGRFPTTRPNPVSDESLGRAAAILSAPQLDALREVQERWGLLQPARS